MMRLMPLAVASLIGTARLFLALRFCILRLVMDPISRSITPETSAPPLLVVRANEEQRRQIYRERSDCFRNNLTGDQYVHKMTVLDGYAYARRRRSLHALVAADAVNSDVRASADVLVTDIFWGGNGQVKTRQAACISSIFVQMHHRGKGYARELLRLTTAHLRSQTEYDVALLVGAAAIGMEAVYTSAVQWHDNKSVRWLVDSPLSIEADIPKAEPLYDHELSDVLAIARQRLWHDVKQHDGITFACTPDESSIRFKFAFYRLNWRARRQTEYSAIIGAKVGDLRDPSTVSFSLCGLHTPNEGMSELRACS